MPGQRLDGMRYTRTTWAKSIGRRRRAAKAAKLARRKNRKAK